ATTAHIDRLVRALGPPFPGAFTYLGLRALTVLRASPAPDPPRYEGRVPGRVVQVGRDAGWVDVLTGDGVLRLEELCEDGGTPVPAAAVVRSVKATLGLRVPDLVRRVHELERQLNPSAPAPV
ncbi:MAG: methionyl-tRNA formyltransferase, partial [Actinomycetes bacterium]